ncbi:ABC transporter ATP-binding protein [Microbacterium sp.]|uniref:ABC transporter ATP-binding protein n=1 Tax=Microbacterium sp. TaxID=51671 RepID=UPI0039E44509
MNGPTPLVSVRGLRVGIRGRHGDHELVHDVGFDIAPGRVLGLVGESGSGKSLTALSLMRLHAAPVEILGGEVVVDGRDIVALTQRELNAYRGATSAMVYQNPMSALNPVMRVGDQVAEAIRRHSPLSRAAARVRVGELFDEVGIARPVERYDAYPFELSGGMLQRVVIAMAISAGPRLLIADEATTALDVTTQAKVLDLMSALARDRGMSMLFITHDLAVASEFCDDIQVMYAGRTVERGSAAQVFRTPGHPYTRGLVASLCTLDMPLDRPVPTLSDRARSEATETAEFVHPLQGSVA